MSFQNCQIAGVGVDPAAYHAQKAKRGTLEFVMSSSVIRDFGFCPRKWMLSKPDDGTRSTDYGQLLETLVLLPETFKDRFAVIPATVKHKVLECPSCGSVTDSKTCRKCKVDRVETWQEMEWNNKSETCQKWLEDAKAEGLRPVQQDGTDKWPGLNQAKEASERLMKEPIAKSFLDASEAQVHVTGEWRDEISGLVVPCQCLIDLMPRHPFGRCLGDLKTARSAYPAFWRAASRDMGYNVQGAWNLAMMNAVTGAKPGDDSYRDTFCFLVSENSHPWEVGLQMMYEAEEGSDRPGKLDYGRMIYESWMAWYCQCLKKNEWPGYDHGPETVQGWSIDRADSRDEAAALRAMERKPSLESQMEPEPEFVSGMPT